MLQRHHMYRMPGRGKNFDPAFFLAVFPVILTLQMHIKGTVSRLSASVISCPRCLVRGGEGSVFLVWFVTFTKSFTSLVSRVVVFFFYAATSNYFVNVKSHARKKPLRVGYFFSLSVDQIKTRHQE